MTEKEQELMETDLKCTGCINQGNVFCPKYDYKSGFCFERSYFISTVSNRSFGRDEYSKIIDFDYCSSNVDSQSDAYLPYFSCPINEKCY